MTSSQVNFFLNLEDQISLNSKFLNCEDMIFCKYRTETDEPVLVESTRIMKMGSEPLTLILCRRGDIENIKLRRIKGKNISCIDVLLSPIIQYSRCYVTGSFIRRGRLYFTKNYFDQNGLLIEKDPSFIDWANRILKEVRAGLSLEKHSNYYGTGAILARANGVEMVSF